MLSISIDMSAILNGLPIYDMEFRQIGQAIVNNVSDHIYRNIRDEASKGLHSTRDLYVRNINRPQIGVLKGSITLTGMLPNMIEQGAPAFDMKAGFMKSPKIKFNKSGGWYMTIPFRWATPGALGENEAFAGVMPKEIYEMAKNLKPNRTGIGGAKQRGGSITEGMIKNTKFGVLGIRPSFSSRETGNTYGQYTYKSPIHQGIQRDESTYAKALQSSYISFRRVGSNSAKEAFIHPGFTAKDFMPKALDDEEGINVVAANTVDTYLTNMGL